MLNPGPQRIGGINTVYNNQRPTACERRAFVHVFFVIIVLGVQYG
ncbi:MAG: hypothetical protein PVG32_16815 [Anaerolineales bacterium]